MPKSGLGTRWRFSAARLVLLLVLGTASTLIIAWMCQLFARTQAVDYIEGTNARTHRPPWVRAGWDFAFAREDGRGFGRNHTWYLGVPGGDVLVAAAGWPLPAVQMVVTDTLGPRRSAGPLAPPVLDWAFMLPERGIPARVAGRPLPVLPVLPGFFIDIAVFAIAWWPALGGVSAVQARIRLARGRCGACGYPVGASSLCTECGAPISARAAAPTQPQSP